MINLRNDGPIIIIIIQVVHEAHDKHDKKSLKNVDVISIRFTTLSDALSCSDV